MSDRLNQVEDYHASRPGPIAYLLMAIAAGILLVVSNRTAIENLLGIQF